jgi:hypothetical protein
MLLAVLASSRLLAFFASRPRDSGLSSSGCPLSPRLVALPYSWATGRRFSRHHPLSPLHKNLTIGRRLVSGFTPGRLSTWPRSSSRGFRGETPLLGRPCFSVFHLGRPGSPPCYHPRQAGTVGSRFAPGILGSGFAEFGPPRTQPSPSTPGTASSGHRLEPRRFRPLPETRRCQGGCLRFFLPGLLDAPRLKDGDRARAPARAQALHHPAGLCFIHSFPSFYSVTGAREWPPPGG